MARDPEILAARLRERTHEQADLLERRIDADMDRNWHGGEFRFCRYQGELSEAIVAELGRRYDRWTVRQETDPDGDGTLVFTPLLREHRRLEAS